MQRNLFRNYNNGVLLILQGQSHVEQNGLQHDLHLD